MEIEKVEISNFRSIANGAFYLVNKVVAIVGENNSGKTALLRAINSVFNFSEEEQFFINKTHQHTPRKNTNIVITFKDIIDQSKYGDYIEENKLTICFNYCYSKNRRKLFIKKGKDDVNIDEEFMEKLKSDIDYVYIPASRTFHDIAFEKSSIVYELVTGFAAQHTENRDRISSKIKDAASRIHDTMLVKLEKNINSLYMQNKDIKFTINFNQDLDYTALLKEIKIRFREGATDFPLEEWGSGTKSLSIIAMYMAYAKIKRKNVVLGIEEPEINLHPQAQKRFVFALNNQVNSNDVSAIITTHSSVIINELKHEDIVLVRKENADRGFKTIISQMPLDFWDKHNIKEFQHYQFFNYKNSDFFFSKFIIIGESKNDCQVFNFLVQDELEDKMADISFLDVGGIENIRYPYYLLKELKIPFIMIVDKDFFFEYKNDNLKSSRNFNGLPTYKAELKNNQVLKDCFKKDTDRSELIKEYKKGYKQFFNYIKKFDVLSIIF